MWHQLTVDRLQRLSIRSPAPPMHHRLLFSTCASMTHLTALVAAKLIAQLNYNWSLLLAVLGLSCPLLYYSWLRLFEARGVVFDFASPFFQEDEGRTFAAVTATSFVSWMVVGFGWGCTRHHHGIFPVCYHRMWKPCLASLGLGVALWQAGGTDIYFVICATVLHCAGFVLGASTPLGITQLSYLSLSSGWTKQALLISVTVTIALYKLPMVREAATQSVQLGLEMAIAHYNWILSVGHETSRVLATEWNLLEVSFAAGTCWQSAGIPDTSIMGPLGRTRAVWYSSRLSPPRRSLRLQQLLTALSVLLVLATVLSKQVAATAAVLLFFYEAVKYPIAWSSGRRQHPAAPGRHNKQFAKPFASGWYHLLESDSLAINGVLPVTAFGTELVVFRGQDEQPGVSQHLDVD